MKKTTLILIAAMLGFIGVNAQELAIPEPEFAGQVYVVTSDSTYTKLPRENASVKMKAGASLYLTGIGKVKARVTLEGASSSVTIPAGEVRLILKARSNLSDPQMFISAFRFEVKGNERRAQIAEAGTFSGAEANTLNLIDYNVEKYGESSYLLVFDNLKAGEYGILTKTYGLKVSTFTVK